MFPINLKTNEPIEPPFFVTTKMTCGKVYEQLKVERNFKKYDFRNLLKLTDKSKK